MDVLKIYKWMCSKYLNLFVDQMNGPNIFISVFFTNINDSNI